MEREREGEGRCGVHPARLGDGDVTRLDGRLEPVAHEAAAGHLLVEPRVDRHRVRRAPVAHHPALEAEALLQVTLQRLRVFARPDLADAVVRAHHRADARLDRAGKGRVVELELCPLVDHLAHAAAVALLVVVHPVLGVGDDALRLDAFHGRPDHHVAQVRILARDVLEVAAVLWDASEAHARAKLNVGALGKELLAHAGAPLLRCLRVEGGGDGQRAWPSSRGPEVRVVPEALRAVVHLDGRDAEARVLAHVADVARALLKRR
jgi:hypothetical protein